MAYKSGAHYSEKIITTDNPFTRTVHCSNNLPKLFWRRVKPKNLHSCLELARLEEAFG